MVALAASDQRRLEYLKSEGVDLERAQGRWRTEAGWAPQDDTDCVNVYVAKEMAMRGRTLHKIWVGLGGVREEIYCGFLTANIRTFGICRQQLALAII